MSTVALRRRAHWPWRRTVAVALLVLVGVALAVSPLRRWTGEFIGWLHRVGPLGYAVYAAVYFVLNLLLVPGWILTFIAGALWGFWKGLAVAYLPNVLGGFAAFFLARTALRDRVSRWLERHPRFRGVDRAVREHEVKVTFLIQLSPILPLSLLSYVLGLTRVRARVFLPATALGALPGTLLYLYLGHATGGVVHVLRGDKPDTGAVGNAFFWIGLACTALATLLVTWAARRELRRSMPG